MCERIVAKTSVRMLLSLLLIFGSVNPAMSVLRKGETSLGTSFESYFPLKEIRLSDGPFLDLQQKGKEYLLWLNPDSLLHFYRIEAGLSSKVTLCRLGVARSMGSRPASGWISWVLSFFRIDDVSIYRR